MNSGGSALRDEHEALSNMWAKTLFEPAIHHIRFPNYKNLAVGLKIELSHPVTALVGPNGTNKTSILRALQGCPGGNDLGRYWFGTAVDAIATDDRHRFIYGRHSETTGGIVEVVKTRIGRKKSSTGRAIDPDLFEPSRPLLRPPDSMDRYDYTRTSRPSDGSATRWNAIEKEVLYLDFRSQLSAFDWAFHHSNLEPKTGRSQLGIRGQRQRKDLIRRWTPRLALAIKNRLQTDVKYNSERIIEPARRLTPAEVATIGKILGRQYDSITTIHHKYFSKHAGWTALMRSGSLNYSEAFAGSGEFAVVMLVTQLLNAEDRSLILLDEPEVSLHPAAQHRLMDFLVETVKTGRHQVVLATHSPEMIRRLPPNAVKVLSIREDDGFVDLPTQEAPPHVAFEAIGAKFEKPAIVVEDRLALAVVRRALKSDAVSEAVNVRFIPGGASTLWGHYLPMWSEEGRADLLLYLDGDQTTGVPPPVGAILESQLESTLVDSLNGNTPKLPFGSKEVDSAQKRLESVKRAIQWRSRFVAFLPFETPEQFLWPYRLDPDLESDSEKGSKEDWEKFVSNQFGADESVAGDDIFAVQRQALGQVPDCDLAFISIRQAIAEFVGMITP